MYPWQDYLDNWANGTGIHIDALGLVTLLGADEIDRSVGRLVPSPYLDYLPLLGAFTVAASHFTAKQSGFTLYNISDGVMTTELAGWFSRWLQAQEFHRVRSIVSWEVADRPPQLIKIGVGLMLIGWPIHGMLIALTLLAADWWGFANVMAMLFTVVVRCVLVSENQAGIDYNIKKAEKDAIDYNYPAKRAKYDEALARLEDQRRKGDASEGTREPIEPKDPGEIVKVIVVTDDSKAVTIAAPRKVAKLVFATNPEAPNPRIYRIFQSIGWAAFAVHVISIGMAQLYTQICTVVVIIGATILTAYKVGCGDSRMSQTIRNAMGSVYEEDQEYSCWVSSKLKATVSIYPVEFCKWTEAEGASNPLEVQMLDKKSTGQSWNRRRVTAEDLENRLPPREKLRKDPGRQDLYAWLDLTEEEDTRLNFWGMIPHNPEWLDKYTEKKMFHRRRMERWKMLADSKVEAK
jgi:hypothetical protein